MDNFLYDYNARRTYRKQAPEGMAGGYDLPVSVDDLDRAFPELGIAAAKRRAMGAVLPQPSQVALSAEVMHTMGTANERQVGGDHYQDVNATGVCPHCGGTIQHWDWASSLQGLEYAATKYLARWRLKNPLESLEKVLHYVQKIIEQNFRDVEVRISIVKKE